jgi:predicted AlkP superfamily phosphohydrolase/phosphomutase
LRVLAVNGNNRTLVIGLDAFEPSIAGALMSLGRLPNFARLASASARFPLDQGEERYTGQTWHQIATGLHPTRSGRWSAIRFDPRTFEVAQPDTAESPFTRELGVRTVVFDVPHFNLGADALAQGVVNWGCHDAGVQRTTRPKDLWTEIEERFGAYPAKSYIYGIVWEDPEGTARMARELVNAVEMRRRICHWLLAERLSDWDLALVALPEFHSVIETMWHGWDADHPLHGAPAAPAAREALVSVYEAADRLLGDLMDAFPEATLLAFAPHGMGANHADVPAMILLAELMYRWTVGTTALRIEDDDGYCGSWSAWVNERLSFPARGRGLNRLLDWMPTANARQRRSALARPSRQWNQPLDWMPTARYRHAWPLMKAFAIPAYHDARIRVNLAGREAHGIVRRKDYRGVLEEIAALISSCVDAPEGRQLDCEVLFTDPHDPLAITEWETDIVVRFKRNVLGLRHPTLGQIGPVPHRRTGGHTGSHGIAYVKGRGVTAADRGVVSTFDVVPAICDLARGRPPSAAFGHG